MKPKQLEALCLSLPGATVDIKWGADVCYCIGGKMFAVTGMEGGALTLKVGDEMKDMLLGVAGITPAPYLARHGWLLVDDGALGDPELADLVRRSYGEVSAGLSAAVRRRLGVPGSGPEAAEAAASNKRRAPARRTGRSATRPGPKAAKRKSTPRRKK